MTEEKLPVLLNEIANIDSQEDRSILDRFKKRWPELFAELDKSPRRVLILRDLVRRLWMAAPTEESIGELSEILASPKPKFSIDWRRQELSYEPQSVVQRVLHYLLQHSSLALVCGNSECTHPYFIARRANERYCTGECFTNAQRQSAQRWWSKHGKDWRESRRSSKERTVKSYRKPTGGGR